MAESREIIPVGAGSEFRCPHCDSKLWPVQGKGVPLWLLVLGGLLLLGVAGVGGWLLLKPGREAGFPPLTVEQWSKLATRVQGPLLDEPITFPPGQIQITEENQNAIVASVPRLERYPRSRLVVEAHVASSDSPSADQKLSDDRASEVKKFLMAKCGVLESRVLAKGCGSEQPPERVTGESEQEWKRRARSVRILLVGD